MSGRIRTIKPEWLEDELLALASDSARVLSVALMLLADDYGNGRANPLQLAGQVFPGKVPETAANALEDLRAIRFVVLYEVDGQRYFSIRNWDKHQRVDKPGKNRVPFPAGDSPEISGVFLVAEKVPESLANLPGNPANLPASRGSEVQVQVLVSGPVPDPGQPPPTPPPPRVSDPDLPAIQELFEFWRANTTNQGCKLTDSRRSHLRCRLKEFTLEELKQVVVNCKNHPDFNGSKGTVYDDVDNLFRNRERVEKLLKAKTPPNGRLTGQRLQAPRQPDSGYDPFAAAEMIVGT